MNTKICSKCREEKDFLLFATDKNRLSGRFPTCKECVKSFQNNRYASDPDYKKKRNKSSKKYKSTATYRERQREIFQYRQKNDPNFRIRKNSRKRIWDALKGAGKSASTTELIGCSIPQLKAHLESQFQPGMSWANYGDWHIDHRLPCASFDLSNPEQQRVCFHYSNLQPLWAADNLSKGPR